MKRISGSEALCFTPINLAYYGLDLTTAAARYDDGDARCRAQARRARVCQRGA
jgi:hypothetical protein